MAPGAEFFLAYFSNEVEFGNAVDWLIGRGVDVISSSVGWPTGGSGDGTGPICDVVNTARAAGILWVQAAGNQAQKHWQGTWNDTDGDGLLNFSDTDELNIVMDVTAGSSIVFSLRWDDPWGTSSNDYDLLLFDSNNQYVTGSLAVQDGTGGNDYPYEVLAFTAHYNGYYSVAIINSGSASPVNFHLYSYYHAIKYRTASGSIIIPADSPNAMTVGAVHYASPGEIEPFSSIGPTDDGRLKPDIVAPDGVSTASYGMGAFSGTSASAPHAAGAAVLAKQLFPAYTPAQLQAFLEGRAVDLGSAGKDNTFGSGRLSLGSAGAASVTMSVAGNGTTMPAPGTHTYPVGTTANITAMPDAGWRFSGWTGDNGTIADISSDNTSIMMNGDYSITANFDRPVLTVTVNGSGATSPAAGAHPFDLGSTVNITAAPGPHWAFASWTGDNTTIADAGAANTTITMDADYSVTANFLRTHSLLTLEVSGSGAVTPAVGTHTYPVGATVNVTATPATNWEFVNWSGNVTGSTSLNTDITLDQDETIVASFRRVASVLSLEVSGSGTVGPELGDSTYAPGSTVNITAVPASGWRFDSWTGDVASPTSPSTTVIVDNDKTVTANFSQIPPAPQVEASGSGGGGATHDKRFTTIPGSTSDGVLLEEVSALSVDIQAQLDIPAGTAVLNRSGYPAHYIEIVNVGDPGSPPGETAFVGSAYDLGPDGTTFDRPVPLTMRYKETGIPAGASEASLYIATWNKKTQQWERLDCQVNTEINRLSTEISHFSRYAIIAGTKPARFALDNLLIAPGELYQYDNVTVMITVSNTGDLAGEYEAICRVDDGIVNERKVALDGGESREFSLVFKAGPAGEHTVDIGGNIALFTVSAPPADISILDLFLSAGEVDPGEPVDVKVVAGNSGGTGGSYEVMLRFDGIDTETRTIEVAPGEKLEVVFTISADGPGKHVVEVDRFIASFIIRGDTAPPEQIPLPLEPPAAAVETGMVAPPPGPAVGEPPGRGWALWAGLAGGGLIIVIGITFVLQARKRRVLD